MSDIVRVLRVLEYVGPRHEVELLVKNSIHGEKTIERTGITIKAATIGLYPEIFEEKK